MEKLKVLYDRVKSRLPEDFSFEYIDSRGNIDNGHTLDLVKHIENIREAVHFICNMKAIVWINYFNGAYDALKEYEEQ